jgi:UrcA family protein
MTKVQLGLFAGFAGMDRNPGMTFMLRPFLAAALFTLLGAPPAFGAEPQQVVVPIADLDLHSAAGKAELRVRVAMAASTLCRPAWLTKSPDSEFAVRYNREIHRACVGRLTDRALARFNAG